MNKVSRLRPVSGPAASTTSRDDRQQLSDLISLVYDAAIDQSLCENAIERVTWFVDGVGAGLFCKDVDAQHVMVTRSFGVAWPLPVELFRQIYPAAVGHFIADIEEPVATADLLPYDELAATGFYQQWARPRGIIDFVSAVLDKSAASVVMFGVFRHERNGFVDDEARHHMRLIAPHLRRAVMIARMFDLKIAEAGTFADTLDGLDAGLCLVDANGRIIHANLAGQAMLDAGDILCDVAGRLVACDAQAHQTLREVFAAADQGDAALGTRGIAVPLIGRDGERYVAHALPLTSGARRRAGIIYTAVEALFVRRAALAMPPRSEVIGKAFKLTPTELRVLLAIVEVGGVPEVATALGVADTTVRTHVNRLFEKTGVKRQADLVKLVAGYATPLAR
ncbi:MAG: helix-turn-helix transcriptional regulator [Bradyrhizobium sp.]|uniref:helix-turn-helix transcriptional regulator n=1 Tax=Bradyrhizobium sp. TaxID=376 RepID=UPI00272061CF|nr:helix-turn-helix transcriptional regulator [Bradyrhizobium sp.]MDO8398869.1 helix-turn-helix transcriptional regulator [Bradyrhizobium sp.]